MPVVRDDGGTRVQMDGVDSGLAESGGDDDTRQALAEAQYGVGKPGRERTGFRYFPHNLLELVEKPADLLVQLNRLGRTREICGFVLVKLPEPGQFPRGGLPVA